jgi:hypothetical protein
MPRHFLRGDDLAPAGNRRHAQKALPPCPLERAA